jgi:CBS domain containing-hemolysin-like protein
LPALLLNDLLPLLVLLGLSALFSGAETAIFSLQEMDLDEMGQLKGAPRVATSLARRPNRTLITLLLSNMVVNVLFATLATAIFLRVMGPIGMTISIPVVTAVLLLFGEIVPKTIGLRGSRRFATAIAPLVESLARLLYPVRILMEFVTSRFDTSKLPSRLSRSELGTLLRIAGEEGLFSAFETKVLSSALLLGDTPVERLLRPRVEVVGVERSATFGEAVEIFEKSGYSRLPVYEDTLDHVVGVLYLKDLLTARDAEPSRGVVEFMHEPFFVPQSKAADELFAEFQSLRVHFAVVVGEHGGMEGIVTMEDLAEELVGQIGDESDVVKVRLEVLAHNTWRVDAGIELEELGEALGMTIGAGLDAVTLAGFLGETLGRVPQAGDVLEHEGLRFRVLTARPNRPLLVRVTRHGRPSR